MIIAVGNISAIVVVESEDMMLFKKNDRVQIVDSIDPTNPVPDMGAIGTVVEPGDGLTVEGMIRVQHEGKLRTIEAYWPEELEKI